MKRTLPALLISLLISFSAFSQGITITGKVISGSDNQTIPGATVQVKNKNLATVTDINGLYSLKGVKSEDTLAFSFIGYTKQFIAVKGKTSIDVVLQLTSLELKEVVVTALGINRQKRELGFATEMLKGEIVTRSNAPNIISAMTGRSAGVVVSNNDGVEGGSTRIIIRGNTSLGKDNQPLIIVDGVPMENTPGQTNIGRGVDWGNSVNNINSFDIETYNILKGGAATALYGSRGGNGVILITTKRGKQQKGIGISYNMTEKITHPYRFREVQNKYGHGGPISLTPPTFPVSSIGDTLLYPGIYGNDNLILNQQGQTSSTAQEFGYYGSAVSWGPEMNGEMVKWWDGKMRPWSPQPDNLKIPYQDGYTTTHNISASGGNENGTLRVSITRMDQKAIVDNSDQDQTTVNLAGNMKVSSKLRADLSVSYVNYNRLNSIMTGEDWRSLNKGFLYSWPRSYQGEDKENYTLPDGSQNLNSGYPYMYISQTLWWDYYNQNTTLNRDKYLGSMSLIYDITPWLNVVLRTGRDFTLSQFETKHKPTDVVGVKNGYYAKNMQREFANNSEFVATAIKDNIFNSHINVKLSAGASSWQRNDYGISGKTGTWYYPNMYSLVNYTTPTYVDSAGLIYIDRQGDNLGTVAATDYIIRKKINSVYSFLNLGYKGYLFIDLTGRNDWSSTLPKNSNSYFYPSATVSFIASDAFKLHDKYKWLDFLKFRACIAQTATDDEPYQTEFYYGTGFFGGQQTSNFPDIIPPFQLIPQRVNNYEGGMNLSVLNNKIDIDVTYYYGYSFDQIMKLPVPISSGAHYIKINEGTLTNKGVEIAINTVPYETKDIVVKTGINFARNKSRIRSLGANNDVYPLADIWGLNGPAMEVKVGEEFGTIVGWDYVYDANGNRLVNDAGTKYLTTKDRVPIGNASAKFTAGWTTEFTWKNFRLSTLVDTKWGGDIYCGSYVIGLQTGQSPETLIERDGGGLPYTDPSGHTSNIGVILEGVHEDGTPNTTVVHYYYKYLPNAGGWGQFISKPGILENTWVKMREIALAYTFTAKTLRKMKALQSLTVTLTGRDLFYLYTTLPDKINPEGIMGSGNAQGFEWASFPGSRSFIIGINASF
jgi:iron complex outermembrane receptor protein